MNAPAALPPFADVAPTAAHHARLYFFGAVLAWLAAGLRRFGGAEALFARHPFLQAYLDEMDRPSMADRSIEGCWQQWHDDMVCWAPPGLPLSALAAAHGLDAATIGLLFQIGLTEDDPGFAALAADLQDMPGRPAWGVLVASHPVLEPDAVRDRLQTALALGLLRHEGSGPRAGWPLAVPLAVWDALCARRPDDPALHLSPPEAARPLAAVVGAPPGLDAARGPHALRGLPGSGRRTLAAACAALRGEGALRLLAQAGTQTAELLQARRVAELCGAALVLDARRALPDALEACAPLADWVLLPVAGGTLPPGVRVSTLVTPDPAARMRLLARHWQDGTPPVALAGEHRLPAGAWVRLAEAVQAQPDPAAALAVALARRSHPGLEALTEPLPGQGDWDELALPPRVAEELAWLEARCRQRERLAAGVGAALASGLSPGVKALFKGPSGTGKTAAARILAARLGKPAFRLDLARIVSKYIGETEAHLARVFEAAEALDALLLLDEGDALMAGRTAVANANDRYANLETNYLLQAVERFEGILLITTNNAERIDSAFLRRLDVTVDFPAPDAAVRARILALHLPVGHGVAPAFLDRAAARCALTGGQWRNVVLHAALRALEAGRALAAADLEAAIRREYRKAGQVCPLREDGGGP